jgi:Flp pilus assembly protein TadB
MLGLVAGGLAGLGLWLAFDALAPPRASLVYALRPTPPRPPLPPAGGGWAARAGWPLAGLLLRAGVGVRTRVAADLRLAGKHPAGQLAEKATAAAAGVLAPVAVAGLLAVGGLRLPGPLWSAAPVLGAAGWLLPDLAVAGEASRRRRDWRHAVSAFLDLTVLSLAGGSGVEQALTHAAATGDGPEFTGLRRALGDAQLTRTSPWQALGRLGDQLGLAELTELAASVSLAAGEGAKIRGSLAAKAASARIHLLSETDAGAQAATERMSLPVVVMFAGFLLFLGYPAAAAVVTGL